MTHCRVGVIVPWMNRTVEDELPALVAGQGVSLHWARARPVILPTSLADESYLASLLEDVPDALARLAPDDLAFVILACTSAALDQTPWNTRPNRPLITAFECVVDALTDGDDSAILLCTPYSSALTQRMADDLRARGQNIQAVTTIESPSEFMDIAIEEVAQTIASAITPSIGRIVVSCTALYTATLGMVLSRDHGIAVPMISSVSAIAGVIRKQAQSYHHVE